MLTGADVVVDVSNSPSFADEDVMKFFTTSTTNQIDAEKAAGVKHHVALSIVGCDRAPDSGYLRAKVAQEKLIQDSGVPYSIVRATQFFEFSKAIADGATEGNQVRLPHAYFQPMASDDVAAQVARTAVGAPLDGTKETGGPEKFHMDDFIRALLVNMPQSVSGVLAEKRCPGGLDPVLRSLVHRAGAALHRARLRHAAASEDAARSCQLGPSCSRRWSRRCSSSAMIASCSSAWLMTRERSSGSVGPASLRPARRSRTVCCRSSICPSTRESSARGSSFAMLSATSSR